MLDRIRAISTESADLLALIVGYDFGVESAIRWLEAALDDLEACQQPSDEQIEENFVALTNLQAKLMDCMGRTPHQHRLLLENLTDRIDIFLFYHRL